METKKPMDRDEILDAAAGEALGANAPETSEQFQQQVKSGDAETVRAEREMRETVARLALASPYMEPKEELRGKVLQATAPQTFKMEDYRKASGDNRFYKWGFYAAAVFLFAAAYYNMGLESTAKKMRGAIAQQQQQIEQGNKQAAAMNEQLTAVTKEANGRGLLLAQLLEPKTQQVTLRNNQGQTVALAYINPVSKSGVMIVPEDALKAGQNSADLKLAVETLQGPAEVTFHVSLVGARGMQQGVDDSTIAHGVQGTNVKTVSTPVKEANIFGGP